MEPIQISFKDCDRLFLEKTFDLEQVDELPILTDILEKSKTFEINNIETYVLSSLQETLLYRVDDWNEQELIELFIGPVFSLVNFNAKKYGMFSERLLKARVGDYELSGYPDAIVAKGRRAPETPYFCFHEYKKENEPKGEPAGQCLAAMLAAQALNNNERPVFGVVVKGEMWSFVVLKGNEYAISKRYKSTDDELWEIVKILKHIKTIIGEYVQIDLLTKK